MNDHISYDHATYGQTPLCGAAMWDELVTENHARADDTNVCWECASICGWEVSRMIPNDGQLDIFGQEFKPVARSGDPETSWQAARSIDEFKMRELHARQIELLSLRPGTHEGLMSRYARRWEDPISASGFRTRISELRDAGLVRDSGLRALISSGRRAIVWEIGREESLDHQPVPSFNSICPTCHGSGTR